MTTESKIRANKFTLGVSYACLVVLAVCQAMLIRMGEWTWVGVGFVAAGVHFINIGMIKTNLNRFNAQLAQEKQENEAQQKTR